MAGEPLAAALSARARALAEPYAADYAQGNRAYYVVVTRPQHEPTFNRDTAVMEHAVAVPVYEGPARITPLTGSGQVDIGDEPEQWLRAEVSIPEQVARPPQVNDLVRVTAGPDAAALRVLRVTGVTFGGHLDVGWRLACTGVAPSRASGES